MAETKNSKSSDMGTSWSYNPSFTPAQDPNYDYKTQIVAHMNASAVTTNGMVPGYTAGAPKDSGK